MKTVKVFDLKQASDFYACVFDTDIFSSTRADECAMRDGANWFRLRAADHTAPQHDPFVAEVEDADVCIARAATRGGRIIDPVAIGPDRRRSGAVQDPFGVSWRVCSRA